MVLISDYPDILVFVIHTTKQDRVSVMCWLSCTTLLDLRSLLQSNFKDLKLYKYMHVKCVIPLNISSGKMYIGEKKIECKNNYSWQYLALSSLMFWSGQGLCCFCDNPALQENVGKIIIANISIKAYHIYQHQTLATVWCGLGNRLYMIQN